MQPQASLGAGVIPRQPAAWGAVFALSLGAFALVASEFMPVSLLTPIASDLRITEGQAGQAISVSGAFAVLTSLFIASLAGRLDRKHLLLVLTGLMIVSGTIVAVAPNYVTFMAGRAFIGVAIGGFLFDTSGYQATFGVSAMLLVLAALLAFLASRSGPVRGA